MAFIGNTVQTQGFTPAIDYFNGNGVTVTFTLSRPIASVAQVIVAIDNVIQNPSSSFTVAGNAITFSSAPLSGTNNIWVEYTSLITTYQAISQDPTVVGDIRATGGYLAEGDFGNSFVSGAILDYVTGMGRVTVGPAEGITLYNGGTAARTALMTVGANGKVGIGTTTLTNKFNVAGAIQSSSTVVDVAPNTVAISQEAGYSRLAAFGPNSSTGGTLYLYSISSNGGVQNGAVIDSSGNLLVGITSARANAGDVQVSKGISFPATQSAQSDANTLDDYEEGTFSPTFLGSGGDPTVTYTNQTGFYTKIGNMVYISCNVQWSTFSGGSGLLFFGNLPFAASSSGFQGGGVISYAFGFPAKGMLYMDAGTARFVTQRVDSPTGYINISDVAGSGHIMFGMFYRV